MGHHSTNVYAGFTHIADSVFVCLLPSGTFCGFAIGPVFEKMPGHFQATGLLVRLVLDSGVFE
jgi:hypothetical protein